MVFKYIIRSVIIMVIALLVFSYIVDSSTKYKINNFFSEAKSKISSTVKENIEKIPTPKKSACEEKAKELIPKHIALSNHVESQLQNKWNDGEAISFSGFKRGIAFEPNGIRDCIRSGSGIGENVNYYYLDTRSTMNGKCTDKLSYSKTIISEEGVILGTNSFEMTPVLKENEKQIKTDSGIYDDETDIYTFSWEGFDDEMKKRYGADKIYLKIKSGDKTICENESSEEKGYFECKGYSSVGWRGGEFIIIPDIYDNKIYELIDYNITSCNWVEE